MMKMRTSGNSLTFFAAGLTLFGTLGGSALPLAARFAISVVLFFFVGRSFQKKALAEIRSFRIRSTALIWLVASVCFWTSVLLWVWWSRGGYSFPLFLLNDRLQLTVYFEGTQIASFFGYLLCRSETNAVESAPNDEAGVRENRA